MATKVWIIRRENDMVYGGCFNGLPGRDLLHTYTNLVDIARLGSGIFVVILIQA